MRPLEMKTPAGRRALGEAAVQRGSDKANGSAHGTIADPPCYCRTGAETCITCLSWARRITGIMDRRADSLRRQALGQRAVGGL